MSLLFSLHILIFYFIYLFIILHLTDDYRMNFQNDLTVKNMTSKNNESKQNNTIFNLFISLRANQN